MVCFVSIFRIGVIRNHAFQVLHCVHAHQILLRHGLHFFRQQCVNLRRFNTVVQRHIHRLAFRSLPQHQLTSASRSRKGEILVNGLFAVCAVNGLLQAVVDHDVGVLAVILVVFLAPAFLKPSFLYSASAGSLLTRTSSVMYCTPTSTAACIIAEVTFVP
mgnify:CR=1 FL=1